MPKLILGSSSKWRKKILRAAGYDFGTVDPNIDEKAIRRDDPVQLTVAIAKAKADAVLAKYAMTGRPPGYEDALLITSDQVVQVDLAGVLGIYEKPDNREQAAAMLRSYGEIGFCVTVTAVVVTHIRTKERVLGVDFVKVTFDPIPEDAIAQAVDRGEVMGSCGAFVHDDRAIAPYIRKMYGPTDSVDGMPLFLLKRLLAPFGA